jgi:N-glycosidase YbiA
VTNAAPEKIWFHSKNPETGWLSNFSPHRFDLDDRAWPSVEHYYQAQKFPGQPVAERIRAAAKPVIALKLAQVHAASRRSDWDSVKINVMARALEAKFAGNRTLRAKLLETGDSELIHLSKSDKFWGRSEEGEGANQLGELLMALRTKLRAGS